MTIPSELDSLLNAYAAERTDDAQSVSTMFGLLATAVGLLSLIGFALLHAKSDALPAWAIALAPLVPLPFVAYGALLTHLSNVRGQVIDLYEHRIRGLVGGNRGEYVPAPFGHTILNSIWQGTYARTVIAVAFASFFSIYVAVLIESFRYARKTAFDMALASLVGCSAGMMLLIVLFAVALFPQKVINRTMTNLARPKK
jgi:hypothetical protein